MASTKANEKNLNDIEAKLKLFSGDLVRIEYLENTLKQLGLPNDSKRFCHIKLAELYEYRLMWTLAAKNMEAAAECATNFKDKITFYMKEITLFIKVNDYLGIDKAFKKAILCANTNQEKEALKEGLKKGLLSQAQDYEKKNKRSGAAAIYEKLIDMPITTPEEKKALIEKVAKLNAGLGKLREAIRYEQMLKRPLEVKKPTDGESNVRRISFEDLGIDSV